MLQMMTAQDPEALEVDNAVLRALAALRRVLFIGFVMVAMDVQQGLSAHGYQKGQVFKQQKCNYL